MKSIVVIFVLAISAFSGCTLGPYVHERDAVRNSTPPCLTGDICPISFDGPEIHWAVDVLRTVR